MIYMVTVYSGDMELIKAHAGSVANGIDHALRIFIAAKNKAAKHSTLFWAPVAEGASVASFYAAYNFTGVSGEFHSDIRIVGGSKEESILINVGMDLELFEALKDIAATYGGRHNEKVHRMLARLAIETYAHGLRMKSAGTHRLMERCPAPGRLIMSRMRRTFHEVPAHAQLYFPPAVHMGIQD